MKERALALTTLLMRSPDQINEILVNRLFRSQSHLERYKKKEIGTPTIRVEAHWTDGDLKRTITNGEDLDENSCLWIKMRRGMSSPLAKRVVSFQEVQDYLYRNATVHGPDLDMIKLGKDMDHGSLSVQRRHMHLVIPLYEVVQL